MERKSQSVGDSKHSPASDAQTDRGERASSSSGASTPCAKVADPLNQPDRERFAPSPGQRDGQTTVADLVDAYMAAYSGRDTSRTQRLQFWVARLGGVTLADLSDDEVFLALEDLATRRGRYFAGKDADGNKILKAKSGPLRMCLNI